MAGAPAPMPTSFNGFVGQGGQYAIPAGGQHIQQLYSNKQGPAGAYAAAGLGPGQYSLKALMPSASNAAATAHQQMQQDLHTTDQHDRLAQQQQQHMTAAGGAAGPAAAGIALVSAHPAVTGANQAAAAAAAGVKQEPGSPPANSPTSLAPAAVSSSPTPEAASAAAAGQPGGGAATAAGRFRLSPPTRQPPPDPSEGPEVAAEYEKYLVRWEQGATLAQRWHRLSERGVLGDLVEEWEEWQHDLMLQEIQRHNKTLASRARKHKREEPEVDLDAPRQTRTRRVPTALQDYQVEAVTGGTPEPPNIAGHVAAGPTAANGARVMGGPGGRGAGAQQSHNAALDVAGLTYADPAAAAAAGARVGQAPGMSQPARRGPVGALGAAAAGGNVAPAANAHLAHSKQQQQQHDGYQQQHAVRGAGHSNGYSVPHQQQQQQAAYGRAGAPQASQGLGSWPAQPQQQQLQPQHQQQRVNGAHYSYNTQEMVQQILHMGSAVGSAIANNSATAPASAAAGKPASLPGPLAAALPQATGFDYGAAFEAFSKVLGRVDPVAFTQHISAAVQQQFQQQQQ